MGLRRAGVTRDYEEMPGANVPVPGLDTNGQINEHIIGQEFEMASVSVVPDGNLEINFISFTMYYYNMFGFT